MLQRSLWMLLAGSALLLGSRQPSAEAAGRGAKASGTVLQVLLRDGKMVEGKAQSATLTVQVEGKARPLAWKELLSAHLADPASVSEQERIESALKAVAGTDRAAQEAAVAELEDIGLPALSPLLAVYKDTDVHEPNALYRLFARLMPGQADHPDRTLDLFRLANGEMLRGDVPADTVLSLQVGSEPALKIPVASVRRIAVRRREIKKTVEVHSLHHCTQIAFLDSGVLTTSDSQIDSTARGFARLSFDIDGWASDPDGLKKPGPNYKTNLVDGFPFGALVGRIGPAGERWMAGRTLHKQGMANGRLYFAVNDNGHWQNNIGSYLLTFRITDAYDVGEPQ